MNIAKTLYQRVLLASLVLAILSLFLGFFSMKYQQEGFFMDTRYETHAQIHNAATGFKTHQIVFNRAGIADHRVNFSEPNSTSRIFAIVLMAALFTGAVGAVWGSKKGAVLSAMIGALGLVALYFIVQFELTPGEAKLRGVNIIYDTGFYIAIVALIGYVVGGALAFAGGTLKLATAAGGEGKRFCGECGAPAGDSGKFCGSCGSTIK